MKSDLRSEILDRILDSLDRGEDPELDRLAADYPEHDASIRELHRLAIQLGSVEAEDQAGEDRDGVPELRGGDQLGDFAVERPLGSGGMGRVYVARQLSLGGRRVALKVLGTRPSAEGRARFEREAMLLAPLHHPNLAEVYGFGEERGTLFLAMQLVRGRDLRSILSRLANGQEALGPPGSVRRIVQWGTQLSEALAVVHAEGLMHRDVKPSNVVIECHPDDPEVLPDGKAVLVDFGLVRPVEESALTRTGGQAATPGYASPEQLLGLGLAPNTDTFALGVTLYDLLRGQLPGNRPQASAGLEPLHGVVRHVDPDLSAIIAKAVDPVAKWRYSNGSAMLRDLRAWFAGKPVSARHRPLSERASRWFSEHPSTLLAGIGVATAAVGVLWLVAAFARWSDAANSAMHAYENGQILVFTREVESVPSLIRPILLRDEVLAQSIERIQSLMEEDTLVRISRQLKREDMSGALLTAAGTLRSARDPEGMSDPLLVPAGALRPARDLQDEQLVLRFFENVLRSTFLDTNADVTTVVRNRVLVLVARLFHERQVASEQDARDFEALRRTLREVWDRADLDNGERLLLLTALSGAGNLADITDILDWILGDRGSTIAFFPRPEERRLGLACVERILRRGHRTGGFASIDLNALEERLAPYVRSVFESLSTVEKMKASKGPGVPNSVRRLALSIVLAQRSLGRSSRLPSLVPDGWSDPTSHGFIAALDLASGAGYSWAREHLIKMLSNPGHLSYLGKNCAWLADDNVTARVRNALEEAEQADSLLARFEGGLQYGRRLAIGVELRQLPDSDTLLGRKGVDDSGYIALATQESGAVDADEALGVWDFTGVPVCQEGIARSVRARLAHVDQDERGIPYLRFGDFERSAVELEFDAHGDRRPLRLSILHVVGARSYYPYSGSVWLEVALDDIPVGRYHVVASERRGTKEDRAATNTQQVLDVTLTAERLWKGRHALSIRLLPETVTTYRLRRVLIDSID